MTSSPCQATGGTSLAFSAREGALGVAQGPVWWPRVPCGGCRDHPFLPARGMDTHGLCPEASPCPALPGFRVGCTGGCVCPVPEHPPACHQLVPESVPIPWGHNCHVTSRTAPRGDRRCCQRLSLLSPPLVLPPVPGAAVAVCLSPCLSVPSCSSSMSVP